jgi:hypothetical protein
MSNCSNCGAALSCGCQKRKASDGASVCANCVNRYEAGARQRTIKPLAKPVINAPQHSAWGPNRYKKT